MRSRFGLISLALIAAVVLAVSCAPAAAPSPTTGPSTSAPAAQATTPPAAATAAEAPAAQASPAAAATGEAAAGAPSGTPIKIGFVSSLSGTYAALGQDQAHGGELAVKEINEAGGILGRPVEFLVRDDKVNPQEAAKQAEQLVTIEKVDIVTGCVSAATELAMNDVAKRANLPFLGTCQSNKVNAKPDRGPYTFHFALTPWMNNQMVLPWITQNLGTKMYVLLADYAWGHENLESIDQWLAANKLQPIGSIRVPLGTTDFSTIIPQIQAANPEVLYAVNSGNDAIAFIKQAHNFGLTEQMKIYHPVVDVPFDREMGFANVAGTYGGANFTWQLQETLPSAKKFVEAFAEAYNTPPSGYAAYQYVALHAYADAAKQAGSIEPAKVAAALEGMQFDYAVGPSFIRACDHQLFQPAHIVVGQTEAEAKDVQPWPQYAFRKVVQSIQPDEKYERSCEELNQ